MRALLLSSTFFVLLINIGNSEDDMCETVRLLKKKVSMRCCQIDNSTIYISDNSSEEVTMNLGGILYKCEDLNRNSKPNTRLGRIVSPKSYEKSKGNHSDSAKANITVPDLTNRHLGDVPARCPDDMILDSIGECVEVWD